MVMIEERRAGAGAALQAGGEGLPDLYDPAAFERWWTLALGAGRGREELLDLLEADGRPVAFARASLLAQGVGDFERWRACVARALETDEPAVETFAMARLGLLEVTQGLSRESERPAREAAGVPVLRQVVRNLRRAVHTPLVREAEARTRYALAGACLRAADHRHAAEEARRAAELADLLGLTQLRASAQLALGQAFMGQDDFEAALGVLEALEGPDVDPNVLVFARINRAIMRFFLGEDRLALEVLTRPAPGAWKGAGRTVEDWRSSMAFAMGLERNSARPGELAPGDHHPHAGLAAAYDLLAAADYERLLSHVASLAGRERVNASMRAWFEALAELRLGRVEAAAAALDAVPDPTPAYRDARLLRRALALEIALARGASPEPFAAAARAVLDEGSPAARAALARRVAAWLPRAAAHLHPRDL